MCTYKRYFGDDLCVVDYGNCVSVQHAHVAQFNAVYDDLEHTAKRVTGDDANNDDVLYVLGVDDNVS